MRRITAGDRVWAFVLVAALVLLGMTAVGPLQQYTAAADRVDELAATRDRLAQEVDELEERRERLADPEELELIARSQHGLVLPGEIPYVVVTPEPELEQVRPESPDAPEGSAGPWYRRLGEVLRELFS